MYVLTSQVNDYNQYGDYLEAVFETLPSKSEIEHITGEITQEYYEHLVKGGGREGSEYSWYYLKSVKHGQKYISSIS